MPWALQSHTLSRGSSRYGRRQQRRDTERLPLPLARIDLHKLPGIARSRGGHAFLVVAGLEGVLQALVDDDKRVGWVVDDVLVDRHAVEVLLEDGPQVAVLLVQAVPLLLNCHDIDVHLVVPLEEAVDVVPLLYNLSTLIHSIGAHGRLLRGGRGIQSVRALNAALTHLSRFGGGFHIRIVDGAWLLERHHLLLLCLHLAAQLRKLEDLFRQLPLHGEVILRFATAER
mmetsp:Transcript_14746/g.41522  ORF Transcript_14746/g.41522 Transcript_14746/m.41522 type:complete len:228 (+) Transcript_14746:64-747(+)